MSSPPKPRAAQYVRMSTDQQAYSIAYQTACNTSYARERGYDLVRTYEDAGVSGLTLEKRAGLKALLADVMSGAADFTVVVVYDVSRWGRFQDPDQSGHYEFLCREAGVEIEYSAEPFANDRSLSTTLIKGLKRAMAAEYSRELSTRVSRAKRGLAKQGYWQGGPAPYALRRQVLNPDGTPGPVLERGQHKALRGWHVTLAPGPPKEVAVLRKIFRLSLVGGLSAGEIARTLIKEAIASSGAGPWTPGKIRLMLVNEAYVGTNVCGKVSTRLRRSTRQSSDKWVRKAGAFEPLISRKVFDAVQIYARPRASRANDEQLLEELRAVLADVGRLSRGVIEGDARTRCAGTYHRRFGSLSQAFRFAGYEPNRQQIAAAAWAHRHHPSRRRRKLAPRTDEALLDRLAQLLTEKGALSVAIINAASSIAPAEVYRRRFGGMRQAYALVGYAPTNQQELALDRFGGQAVTQAQAAALRASMSTSE
ncbi:recombinase family protein [Phenylobacterium sp.]|uniref:recombinase family protein n=1 Tax=Phenylobacterium sp. TaxID=1871053 RepID=UPI0039832D8D